VWCVLLAMSFAMYGGLVWASCGKSILYEYERPSSGRAPQLPNPLVAQWDAPTLANGFHPVPQSGRCPRPGYQSSNPP
jgi:hypothetical protein